MKRYIPPENQKTAFTKRDFEYYKTKSESKAPVVLLILGIITFLSGAFLFLSFVFFILAYFLNKQKKEYKALCEKARVFLENVELERVRSEAAEKAASDLSSKFHISISCGDDEPEEKPKSRSVLRTIFDYVVLDLETTGLSPENNQIIEIGAIKYVNDTEIDRFHTMVACDHPLPQNIVELTGITDDMLLGAPSEDDAVSDLYEFIGKFPIVAHNAKFDLGFVDSALRNTGLTITNDHLDTMRYARKARVPSASYKLADLVSYFRIKPSGAHRSLADCESTHLLLVELKKYVQKHHVVLGRNSAYGTYQYHDVYVRPIKELKEIVEPDDVPDPLFDNRIFVISGDLSFISREDAYIEIMKRGGIVRSAVSRKTSYLVSSPCYEFDTEKVHDALTFQNEGCDLQIIDEMNFYQMLHREVPNAKL